MKDKIDKERAKRIISEILTKFHERFKQNFDGQNEELSDRTVRHYRSRIANRSWKIAQKWCKWNDEGPVLMPDYTRTYYRKGDNEVIFMEYPPQIRLMKFTGALAKRENTSVVFKNADELTKVHQYSLALPYTIFIFKFVKGMFSEVRCAFSDRPVKTLSQKPLRPYLSNIDSNLNICLGNSLDKSQLIKDNIVQQVAFILNHFWQTVYSDEWGSHFWENKKHFQANDPRMATMEAWQEHSMENPLFVIDDVNWIPYHDTNNYDSGHENNFGEMIDSIFKSKEEIEADSEFKQELYDSLAEKFLTEIIKNNQENIDSIEDLTKNESIDSLADYLISELTK